MDSVLGQKYTAGGLLRFSAPSIIMMMFMSLYTIVDGMFASRYVGSDALAAINIVFPILTLQLAVGLMIATGGSALVGRTLGEAKSGLAREYFTMLMAASVLLAFASTIAGLIYLEPLCFLLGSDEVLLPYCKTYLCIMLLFSPACMLQTYYQSLLVTAGLPKLGLALTCAAGLSNVVLDYCFMGRMGMGIAGAALATGIGQSIPAVLGSLLFLLRKRGLRFSRFQLHLRALAKACSNGSSEMVTQLSMAVVTFLFNVILMDMAGAAGVAAITIILYGQFLFGSFYLGFSIGVAPLFSYSHGAGDVEQLRRLLRFSLLFMLAGGAAITSASIACARPVTGLFVDASEHTYALAVHGFVLFSINYPVNGLNILTSGVLTALSDGLHSAMISFTRTFALQVAALLFLPRLIGLDGVWLAVPAAEFATLPMAIWFLWRYVYVRYCR